MGSEGACTYRGRKDTPPVTPLQRAGVWCLRKASVTLRENRRRGGNPFREREVCRVHADEMVADGFYFDPLAATPKPVVEEENADA